MSYYKTQAEQLARRSDPASSHVAASAIVKSGKLEGQCKQVHEALKRFPMHTARELSKASGIDYYVVSRRLSVLEKMGLAVRHNERVCTASGTGLKATPWEALT